MKEKPSHAVVVHEHKDSIRETVESIVIAFVLAFLFRTFEAEAFVIPTGSMAPTLMGQHKDIDCPECGFNFQVGVKEDPRHGIDSCVCPNCRFEINFHRDFDHVPPSFKGDRIIVSKFPYEFADPERWDVAVFKYPAQSKTNFIKRIVGLPRETLRIAHGDIYSKPDGTTDFVIQRKPPTKVLAMLQMVYDNDHTQEELLKLGMPPRWTPTTSGDGAWKSSVDGRTFEINGKATGASWLRYEHRYPESRDWEALISRPQSDQTREQLSQIQPKLIHDFCAYDTGMGIREGHGLLWVGDLAVECELDLRGSGGQATLELIEGGRAFQCRFDLTTGTATLSADDLPSFHPRAQTTVKTPAAYRLRMSNVDDELLVWVDGRLLSFDASTRYELPWRQYDRRDYAPAGVAVEGVAATVRHLRTLRDIYYTPDKLNRFGDTTRTHFPEAGSKEPMDFPLAGDQYFMLGDNSPQSKDSRLWDRVDMYGNGEYYVTRELLIGKAMFVYWPHALDTIPGTNIHLPPMLQWIPNFAKMRFIR